MQTFMELRITGSKEGLQKFVEDIFQIENKLWKITEFKDGFAGRYIEFEYTGEELDRASAFIHIENCEKPICVNNMVPREKSELSYDEYNKLLQCLYDEILKSFDGVNGLKVEIYGGEINIETELSERASKKLGVFVARANPATGSVHPSDKLRWMDFIVQTFVDGCIVDTWHLQRFLEEEKHWAKDVAMDLVIEYENDIELLKYYADRVKDVDG